VFALDLRGLTRYVAQRVARVPGVLRTRTDPLLHVVREGSRWRLGTLDAEQRQAIGERSPSGRGTARDRPRDRELMLALGEDGRMPHAELSERTGIPVTTVRRRLAELLDSGRAVLRCDASARLTGWPETALLRLDVPAEELEETAHGLALLPPGPAVRADRRPGQPAAGGGGAAPARPAPDRGPGEPGPAPGADGGPAADPAHGEADGPPPGRPRPGPHPGPDGPLGRAAHLRSLPGEGRSARAAGRRRPCAPAVRPDVAVTAAGGAGQRGSAVRRRRASSARRAAPSPR